MVRVDNAFKEVKLSATLTNGLSLFNQTTSRKNIVIDKPFIKALLIGVCTAKKVKSEGRNAIHADLLKLTRYLAFNDLVDLCCAEIRQGNLI